MMQKVLFIAPLPPPVFGQAMACQKILDHLNSEFEFDIVNFNKGNFDQGLSSFKRIIEILKIGNTVRQKSKRSDFIYLTLSQSIFGNLRDLMFILLARKQRIIIHLHGGGIKKLIFEKYRLLYLLNKWILSRRVDNLVVLGESLKNLYDGIFDPLKIRVIKNYVDEDCFVPANLIKSKHNNKINVLYMSNLIPGKGYIELLDAAISLYGKFRDQIEFHFAGNFLNDEAQQDFLSKIETYHNITYHGVVLGEDKASLFSKANVFCLPSYYKYFEGQPLSILEAYASGCYVLTTDHGGIVDVFNDKVNGTQIKKESAEDIANTLVALIQADRSEMCRIGLFNYDYAKSTFTEQKYIDNIRDLFTNRMH